MVALEFEIQFTKNCHQFNRHKTTYNSTQRVLHGNYQTASNTHESEAFSPITWDGFW